MLKFLFTNPLGIVITLITLLLGSYILAPVWLHTTLWEGIILNLPFLIPLAIAAVLSYFAMVRYSRRGRGIDINAVNGTIVVVLVLVGVGFSVLSTGFQKVLIYKDNQFTEVDTIPGVSNELVRFKPLQIAGQDIIRKNKSSEFSPGGARAIGSSDGVVYISPLTPQGVFNTFLKQNKSFLYLDDAGTDEERNRVSKLETDGFRWGEDMMVLDNIMRRLIFKVGFTNTYPEIYYAPVYNEAGQLEEVVGVVPYISYSFKGVFVPKWGGTAIFHADGTIEDLTPEQASKDPRLIATYRAYPEKLDQIIVEAQRFDSGIIGGWIRRPGKIEVPELPGSNQMPYYLAMDDATYQYVTAVEPDGDGYSVMRIYYVDSLNGERRVYRFDNERNADKNLVGPAKSLDFVKAIDGYNWYQESEGTSGGSGTYLLIEPRPVTPEGSEHLHWMVTITDKDFSREVATAFVDAETNQVFGPFKTRTETFDFLAGKTRTRKTETTDRVERAPRIIEGNPIPMMCEEIATIYLDYCGGTLP
jgi:hypothetical protein